MFEGFETAADAKLSRVDKHTSNHTDTQTYAEKGSSEILRKEKNCNVNVFTQRSE